MLLRSAPCKRRGAHVVECAIILPLLFLIVFGLIMGAMGVFRYHQVAQLAREASRWASVHGTQYQEYWHTNPTTSKQVYDNAMVPKMSGIDPAELGYQVKWQPNQSPGSTVTVTVTYNWVPPVYFGGITLKSTSVAKVVY